MLWLDLNEIDLPIETAFIAPEAANLSQIWQSIEPVLVSLELHEQLAVGGAVIACINQPECRLLICQP